MVDCDDWVNCFGVIGRVLVLVLVLVLVVVWFVDRDGSITEVMELVVLVVFELEVVVNVGCVGGIFEWF